MVWTVFVMKLIWMILLFCPVDKEGPERYVLSKTGATWSQAQAYCRQHHTGLASIRSMADNRAIDLLVGSDVAWIGLYREEAWSDQSSPSFRYWKTGEPNNHDGNQKCVAASLPDSGKWIKENCLDTLPFFCYTEETPNNFFTLK